jgi:tetratricopeptide (TPR) repeat protein
MVIIMTTELFLIVIAVAVLFLTTVALHCINISDRRKARRNAIDSLFDNARLYNDLKAKRRFRKGLEMYTKKRAFRKVALLFMKIAQKTPDSLDKSYCLSWAGRCYEDFGDHMLAAICYTAAVEISPSDVFSSGQLGDYYWESESRDSEEHYKRALEYDPLSSFTYYKLAKFHSKHGESDKAIARYQTAIDINNGYVAPMAEAAIESAKIGDKSKSLKFYLLAMANDVYEFEKLEEAITQCLSS